jgi:hypothetical protein
MADPPPYPGIDDDTDMGPNRGSTTSAPRWVSVAVVIIAIVMVLLIVVLHLSGIISPGAH